MIALASSQAAEAEPSGGKLNVWFLVLIWACFLVRGIFYSSFLPVWEGYDEFSHFAYVQQLVFPGTLPVINQTPVSKEVEESVRLTPLAWTLRNLPPPSATHDLYWMLPEEERKTRQERLRFMPRDWARQASANSSFFWESQQPPLYYWLASAILRIVANRGLPARVILLRWFSIAIASFIVPLGFMLARRAVGDVGLALGVVALISAMPELMIDISRVANDSLAIPLYTLLVLLALQWFDKPSNLGRAFLVGLVLALGLLTKAYFLTAVPVLAVLPLAAMRRGRNRSKIVLSGMIAGVLPVFLAGWWYLRNHRTTGTWFWQPGAEAIRGVPLMKILSRAPEVDWRSALRSVQISHIWFGDWSFLQVRGWMYGFFWDLVLLACMGIAVCAFRLLRGSEAYGLPRRADFVMLIAFYSLFCVGLAYHALLMFVLWNVSATTGWYLYCLVAVEAILATAGLVALLPKRYARWILPVATSCFALLELYATHFLLIPYYTGLIAHTPNGGLTTFHASMLKDLPVTVVIERLLVNKPYFLAEPILLAIWILFLLSTLSLIVTSLRASRAWQANNPVEA
jgi:4-amino-4-deoxy-L-arabinose transferase-like glycosyltransferase